MNTLGISKNSWHYKTLSVLYSFWGADKEPCHKGLCTYSQTFFWLIVLTLICLPVIVLGWIILKSLRTLYKFLSYISGGKITYYLDKCLDTGDNIDRFSSMYDNSPAGGTIITAFVTIIVTFLLFSVGAVITYGTTALILNISDIPHYLFVGGCYLGYGLANIFYFIGFVLSYILAGIKYISIFIYGVLPTIGIWVSIFIGSVVVFGGLTILVIKLLETKYGRNIIDMIKFKYNGYQTARVKNKEIQEETNSWESRYYRNQRKEEYRRLHPSLFSKIKKFIKERLTRGKTETYGKRKIDVMGTIPLIFQTLKGIYKGICPMIEFIDEKEKEKK